MRAAKREYVKYEKQRGVSQYAYCWDFSKIFSTMGILSKTCTNIRIFLKVYDCGNFSKTRTTVGILVKRFVLWGFW